MVESRTEGNFEGTFKVPYPPELDADDVAIVQAGGRDVVLLKVDGEVKAIDRVCPHEEGDLGEGLMFGKNVKCPVHGWIFELTTGRCLNQRGYGITIYGVEVEGDSISLTYEGGGQ